MIIGGGVLVGVQQQLGGFEPVPKAPYPTMVMVVPFVGKPGCPSCKISSFTGIIFVKGCASEMTATSFVIGNVPAAVVCLRKITSPLKPLTGVPGSPVASDLNDTPLRLTG